MVLVNSAVMAIFSIVKHYIKIVIEMKAGIKKPAIVGRLLLGVGMMWAVLR